MEKDSAKQSPRVLVVEDDEALGQALQLAFEDEGISVRVLGDAESALTVLRSSSYDALLTDKNLPGMSGVELLRIVCFEQPNLAAFLMTAYPTAEAAMETLSYGVSGFIEKPFENIFAVVDKVRMAVERRQQRPSSQRRVTTSRAQGHFSKATQVLQAAQNAHGTKNLPLRILIVNPNAVERGWLHDALSNQHDDIYAVSSADVALRELEHRSPDIFFLDTGLGDLVLQDLLQSAKETVPRSVCVVTTFDSSLNTIIKLIDLGVRAVFEKPLEESTFRTKMDPLLRAARQGKAELTRS